jgi:hypothetical protein
MKTLIVYDSVAPRPRGLSIFCLETFYFYCILWTLISIRHHFIDLLFIKSKPIHGEWENSCKSSKSASNKVESTNSTIFGSVVGGTSNLSIHFCSVLIIVILALQLSRALLNGPKLFNFTRAEPDIQKAVRLYPLSIFMSKEGATKCAFLDI